MGDFSLSLGFSIVTCCKEGCGIVFALNSSHQEELLKSKKSFYCPRGHPQHFIAETKEEFLARKLRQKEDQCSRLGQEVERKTRQAASYKGHFVRVKRQLEPDTAGEAPE